MKSVIFLLECDVLEIANQKVGLDVQAFNAWFDSSIIKLYLKKQLILVQGFRCCYCQKITFSCNNRLWDLEHIVSEDSYPEHFSELSNLAISCSACNTAKSNGNVLVAVHPRNTPLPTRSIDYLIPHPKIDKWSDHVKHTHYLIYEGSTPKGDYLIELCKLMADAAAVVGQTAEAVEQAVALDFFSILPNPIVGLDPAAVPVVLHAAVLAQENARLVPLTAKIGREISKIERRRERAWFKGKKFVVPI